MHRSFAWTQRVLCSCWMPVIKNPNRPPWCFCLYTESCSQQSWCYSNGSWIAAVEICSLFFTSIKKKGGDPPPWPELNLHPHVQEHKVLPIESPRGVGRHLMEDAQNEYTLSNEVALIMPPLPPQKRGEGLIYMPYFCSMVVFDSFYSGQYFRLLANRKGLYVCVDIMQSSFSGAPWLSVSDSPWTVQDAIRYLFSTCITMARRVLGLPADYLRWVSHW